MHRIHIGVVCLLMVLILGVSLEATGKDKDAGEQKVENMSVPMGVIVLKPDESIEQKKSSVQFNHPQSQTQSNGNVISGFERKTTQ